MNSENQNNLDDETSRISEESSSQINTSDNSSFITPSPTSSSSSSLQNSQSNRTSIVPTEEIIETDEMKRAAAKKLIERYFYQLLDGCGNPKCNNKNCLSSGLVEKLTPNQAAARAIKLFSQDEKLCDLHPAKIQRTQYSDNLSSDDILQNSTSDKTDESKEEPHSSNSSQKFKNVSTESEPSTSVASSTSNTNKELSLTYIDEKRIDILIEECKDEGSYGLLVRTLGAVFSSAQVLAKCFQKTASASIDAMLEKAPSDLKNLKKEDLRTLEGDLDKDEDSCADKETTILPHYTNVDIHSLRRSLHKLYQANGSLLFNTINTALSGLAMSLSIDLRIISKKEEFEDFITVFVILFEVITIGSAECLESSLPIICIAATHLPVWAQGRLACIWAEHSKNGCLRSFLQTLQQLITLQVITENYYNTFIQDNEAVVAATKIMKIVYYANILAGVSDSPKYRDEEPDTSMTASSSSLLFMPEDDQLLNFGRKNSKLTILEDPLGKELNVNVMDCRKPYLPFEEFYNEPLSDIMEMDKDYLNYKNFTTDEKAYANKFSFMLYSFILTPATKTLGLYFDSRVRMYSERRLSIFHTQLAGHPQNPYLKLKVRRDHIIDDALVELEIIAMGNPKDFKKQLVVEFESEQGVDEGGVSKEFFQLVVEQIFNPDYGMFLHQEETKTVWFNSTSFENEAQFTLIGIVLGLAIYNNIILAVNFPMVVYRKLMGIKGSFIDLEDWNPLFHKNLKSILDYQENDMPDVFMQTFKICYYDVFGNIIHHELKENGDNIFVSQDNKQEFVDLYTDFLLNKSIDKQFRAFRRGFQMVTDESPLHLLFRPEEIELLVCGSKNFDFNELEQATEYEAGYTAESQIIVDFWQIVHALPIESQRKLLEFTTGSDRVPVGGLSRLKMVIARNGPDCDRLPTSHTCFNVLLLPEYSSKEKLEERLLKAINYSKGFGMI